MCFNTFLWECCDLLFITENSLMLGWGGDTALSNCMLRFDSEVFENIV